MRGDTARYIAGEHSERSPEYIYIYIVCVGGGIEKSFVSVLENFQAKKLLAICLGAYTVGCKLVELEIFQICSNESSYQICAFYNQN